MMAMVRFATTCDVQHGSLCQGRGPEYSAYPSCRHCMRDVCPECMEPGTATEDERNLCVCRECARDIYRDEHPEDFVDTDREDTRQKDDDDGVEYADPRDEMDDRIHGRD